MSKPLLSTLLALTLVGGATTAAVADTRYVGLSGSSEGPVAGAAEPAAARVERLLPAADRYVHDEGTRGPAAWRVIRATGSKTITGILTRPAPSVRTQPADKRVWLELKAVGRVDPKVECHAGGPRTIAAQFGTMLAGGALGGFQPR